MSIRPIRKGPFSFNDFCFLASEDQKADLLDGVIYLSPPQTFDENNLIGWLLTVIGIFAEERNLGQITFNKVAFRLSDNTAPEPDIGFIATSREHLILPGYVNGPPDLAIEIVSPDSVERDYENKRHRYEAAGVREYWIIDPLENTATFLVLEGDSFVEQHLQPPPLTRGDKGGSLGKSEDNSANCIFESRVLPGFELDTRWLFQRPLPPTMPIIRRLLSKE